MLPASTDQAERDDALQKALAIGGSLARELCSRKCGTAGRACITGRLCIPLISLNLWLSVQFRANREATPFTPLGILLQYAVTDR